MRHGPDQLTIHTVASSSSSLDLLAATGAKPKDGPAATAAPAPAEVQTLASIVNVYGRTLLSNALQCHDDELVDALLGAEGVHVNAQTRDGWTLIHELIGGDDVSMLHYLLRADADVNLQNGDGWTALSMAAEKGFMDTAELLIDFRADVNKANNDGRSPFEISVFHRHFAIARMLFRAGADVENSIVTAVRMDDLELTNKLLHENADPNQVDMHSQPLLSIAVNNGSLPMVDLLIHQGADANLADDDGWTPLAIATDRGEEAMVQKMLEIGDVNHGGKHGWTRLHVAASLGQNHLVRTLINKKADVNQVDDFQQMSLHFASDFGHQLVLISLLDAKAIVNSLDNLGKAPIHYAAANLFEDCVRLLLDAGAEPFAQDVNGMTPGQLIVCTENADEHDPDRWFRLKEMLLDEANFKKHFASKWQASLHKAAINGNVDEMQRLLQQLPKTSSLSEGPNQPDFSGRRPLYFAALHGHVEIAQMLLNAKACVNDIERGWNPLHAALANGHKDVATLLLCAKADPHRYDRRNHRSAIEAAVSQGFADLAEMLLKAGSDPNCVDCAIKNGHTHLVRLLLASGANPKSLSFGDDGGTQQLKQLKRLTPLCCAVLESNAECAQILLEAKADVNDKFVSLVHKKTLLHLAVEKANLQTTQLILDAKANPNDTTHPKGLTPFHLAVVNGNIALAELILSSKSGSLRSCAPSSDDDSFDGGWDLKGEHNGRPYYQKWQSDALTCSSSSSFSSSNSASSAGLSSSLSSGSTNRSEARHVYLAWDDQDRRWVMLTSRCSPEKGGSSSTPWLVFTSANILAFVEEDVERPDLIHQPWRVGRERTQIEFKSIDPNIDGRPSKEKLTALHFAARLGNLPMARFLQQKGAQWLLDEFGRSPFLIAANHGHAELVRHWLNETPELADSTDLFGWSASHFASVRSHSKVTQVLAERKGDQKP